MTSDSSKIVDASPDEVSKAITWHVIRFGSSYDIVESKNKVRKARGYQNAKCLVCAKVFLALLDEVGCDGKGCPY